MMSLKNILIQRLFNYLLRENYFMHLYLDKWNSFVLKSTFKSQSHKSANRDETYLEL